MIQIAHHLAKQLRSVLRQSIVEQQTPGVWPVLVCRADGSTLTFQAYANGIGVHYRMSATQPADELAFSAALLQEFASRHNDRVTLEQTAPGKGCARWHATTGPHVLEFATVAPPGVPVFPALPVALTRQPDYFLAALVEAGKTTASADSRYALTCIALCGQAGHLVASDGRQLLVQKGFSFPWQDNVLIPRVAAFANKELQALGPVHIGATEQHVVLQTGPWTFTLRRAADRRYPDIQTVIPSPHTLTTRLHLAGTDAARLLEVLPILPGNKEQGAPITLDLGNPVCVRARATSSEEVAAVALVHSTVTGPPVRLCCNRNHLRRALQLGFTEVSVGRGDAPVVCTATQRCYLFMPFDPQGALAPQPDAGGATTVPLPSQSAANRSQPTVSTPPPNGHADGTPSSERPPTLAELLTEAAALRTVLQDAATRLGRLIGGLKQQRRQSRVVQAAMQSLRQLQRDD